VAGGIDNNTIGKDRQGWFDWMDRNLPDDLRDARMERIISDWTEHDFMAAGEWLLSAPDGGWMKAVAVPAYVKTVAPVDPANAEAWAVTLPTGEERESLLNAIYNSWPKDDAQGKAAFAGRHGIGEPQ
jgi:hypothetical protein